MTRSLTIVVFAGIITLGLFAFMAYLIKQEKVAMTDIPEPIIVQVYELPKDSKVRTIIRRQFQPPEPPPVMTTVKSTLEPAESLSHFEFNPTGLKIENKMSKFNLGAQLANQEARPIIRSNPRYPREALQRGLEGWVRLAFDINKIGEVINIQVVDSQPKRVFDKAAKQALKRWKYKAKSIDGKPIIQTGFTVQLDFNMQQEI
ncbi:energy transducer TonB [Thalassotalea hakodatensis]|uniref:energy transducer TonB n=1 Tax=Thalassotalea hakodatensis TaxID=3030492 RepID=UPI0025736D51|nr:energy transducer TonB [Thalassotalea hakodatensis]